MKVLIRVISHDLIIVCGQDSISLVSCWGHDAQWMERFEEV